MFSFSREEVRDILIAVVALTFIFYYTSSLTLGMSLAIIVVAFLLHELAHKFVAQKFGSIAFFKLWPFGIVIGLALSLVGLIFVAPGAVVIYGKRFGRWKRENVEATMREMGIISVSGPAVNIIIALVSLGLPGLFFTSLAYINAFLAFFNLLPVKPLDGSKVFAWKPWLWLALEAVAIIMVYKLLLLQGII